MSDEIKNPAAVELGTLGAQRRWSGHRRKTLRLDQLPEPVRAAIEALIAAEEAARARSAEAA